MIDRYLIDGVVREGVSCGQCRYDLRGQSRYGRCPECGRAVDATLRALDESYQPLLGHAWLTQVWEGSVLLLIATAMLLVLAVVPEAMYARRSIERVIMLGWICTAWVLGWYGGWKMASREQDANGTLRGNMILRIFLGLYLLLPFVSGLGARNDNAEGHWIVFPLLIVSMVGGAFAGCLLLWRWSDWLTRSGKTVKARVLRGLAVLAPIHFVYLIAMMATLGGDLSSMKLIMSCPIAPIGTAEFARDWLATVLEYPYALPWLGPPVVMSAAVIGMNVVVTRVLHRARKLTESSRPTGRTHGPARG
jgi:hypothetical protein